MIRKIAIIWFCGLGIVFCSPASQNDCESLLKGFAQEMSSSDEEYFLQYVGVSVFLGKGRKVVRPIQLTSANKERVNFYIDRTSSKPKIDTVKNSPLLVDEISERVIGVHRRELDKFLFFLEELKILEFHSQRHLGKAVEFKLDYGCSIWFAPNLKEVTPALQSHLISLHEVKNGWYY